MTDLKAKHVTAVPLLDGNIGVIMVDTKGVVYTSYKDGWKRMSMKETNDDDTTVQPTR